jgi:hypothetical protein
MHIPRKQLRDLGDTNPDLSWTTSQTQMDLNARMPNDTGSRSAQIIPMGDIVEMVYERLQADRPPYEERLSRSLLVLADATRTQPPMGASWRDEGNTSAHVTSPVTCDLPAYTRDTHR